MRRMTLLAVVALVIASCGAAPSKASPSSRLLPTLAPSPAFASASPVPSQATPPSPTVSASTITGEIAWDRLADLPSVSGGYFDAIGFDGGYVVAHGDSGTVQYSADGVTWRTAKLKVPKGVVLRVNAVTTNGSEVVAVGSYTLCKREAWWGDPGGRCRERPASWVTDDGRTWRSSASWKGSVGWGGSAFYHVWSVPGAGFEAAQGWSTEPDDESNHVVGPALWESDDGRVWSLLRAKPAEPSSECDPYWSGDEFQALADPSGHRFAIEYPDSWCAGNDEEPFTDVPAGAFLSVSDDGREYERIAAAPLIGGLDRTLAPVGDGPWVSVGPGPVAWISDDFVTWTRNAMPVPATASAVRMCDLGHGNVGYIATGCVIEGGDCLTWLSDDGASWRIADIGSAGAFAPYQLVEGPEGVLAVGVFRVGDDSIEEDYQVVVWGLRGSS